MKAFRTTLITVLVLMLAASMGSAAGYMEPPDEWDETADVIVIGGGFAGLAAAERAASAGASTILIERMPFVGGNSIINGGVYAAYTSDRDYLYDELDLPRDSFEQHVEDTIAGGDDLPRRELVEQMVAGSPHWLNTLMENGLEVRDTISRPGGHTGYRTYTTKNQSGSDIVVLQQEMAEDAGVDIRVDTNMTYIFREKPMEGRVVGIEVETEDGPMTLGADNAVVLTTGGFAGDEEMRQRHLEWVDADVPTTNHAGNAGDGLQLAQVVGANTIHMSHIQLYPFAEPDTGTLDPAAVVPFSGPSFGIVYVDAEGRRFVDEGERRDVVSMASMDTGMFPTFSIFSDDMYQAFTSAEDLERFIDDGRVLVADTLEELADEINAVAYQDEYIDMDGDVLAETIATHNEYIEQGEDPDFGRTIDEGITLPMKEGPYYAIPQWPSSHHTMGGVEITPQAEVLDIYGNPIEGFFAAGEVTGGLHGTNRLGSNALPDAGVFGLIAGQMAATGEAPEFEILD